jgi:acyl-coenzyme A synthetase/AMP-(fatty) acid ligase
VADTTGEWVDEFLLHGSGREICFLLPEPVDRNTVRGLVAQQRSRLTAAGLRPGGAAALRLPPSLGYVTNLLAIWQSGGQAVLLDHRLTEYETGEALRRLTPQVVVTTRRMTGAALAVFPDVEVDVVRHGARSAGSAHAVIQLSSGSTGPSKIVGRTIGDLSAEVLRYTRIDGVPLPGERIVLLASLVHVLGLVGALVYGLHAGVALQPPARLTGDAVLDAVAAYGSPATVLGVPFHIGLLTSGGPPDRPLPQLRRMITGGERVTSATARAFEDRFGVPLGNMYGMTEVGVIATDLHGQHRPAVAPAPGMRVREVDGELWVRAPASPYLGTVDPTRWSEGWLRTRDAGTVAPGTGVVTVLGRLDSQVSVGGLKVDLTEVESVITDLPEVAAAVVVHHGDIAAYVQRASGELTEEALHQMLAAQLARYKLPRTVHVLDQLPRTTTGKLVRDPAVLRGAVDNTRRSMEESKP